ncbi:MAG: alpha/beta fold hydrolase [Acidimicrobiia bacterium]
MSETSASDRRTITLADGRTLGYAEYGAPGGAPVVNCHGGLMCRLDVAPAHDDLVRLGARVISPDRPGIGASDRSPGRSTADFAADVAELLDALGIERTAVMGWSFGGQYAIGVAARLPDRVTRLAVIAGCLPLDDPATFGELNAMDRRYTWLSRHARPGARVMFSALSMFARRAPARVAEREAKHSPEPDAVALRAAGDWFGRALAEGTRNPAGVVDDYLAAVAPWGFVAGEVQVPSLVHQGSADSLVPPSWAARLAAAIPRAQVKAYEGEGHMIALSRRAEIVGELLA